jgi:hypothetical protein
MPEVEVNVRVRGLLEDISGVVNGFINSPQHSGAEARLASNSFATSAAHEISALLQNSNSIGIIPELDALVGPVGLRALQDGNIGELQNLRDQINRVAEVMDNNDLVLHEFPRPPEVDRQHLPVLDVLNEMLQFTLQAQNVALIPRERAEIQTRFNRLHEQYQDLMYVLNGQDIEHSTLDSLESSLVVAGEVNALIASVYQAGAIN